MFKKLVALFKTRLKSEACLAEEQEYQNDLAALKQAVRVGKERA